MAIRGVLKVVVGAVLAAGLAVSAYRLASPSRPRVVPNAAVTTPSEAPSPERPSPVPTPSRAPAGPSPSPRPAGLHLVAGPYRFPVPAGWTVGALTARSPEATLGAVTDPAGQGRLDYLVDTSPAIYNPDRTVNLAVVGEAIPAAFACSLTSLVAVPDRGPRYTCAAQAGEVVSGQVLVGPYPSGMRVLQVTVPPPESALAQQILAGFS